MSKPSVNLLDLLIKLYADQKGVRITYDLSKEKRSQK